MGLRTGRAKSSDYWKVVTVKKKMNNFMYVLQYKSNERCNLGGSNGAYKC